MAENMRKKFLFKAILKVTFEDSSEESSDDSDIDQIINNYFKPVPDAHIRVKNYIEDIVWQYTDVEFKSHFR